MKLKYIVVFAVLIGILAGAGLFWHFIININPMESFSVDSVLVKTAIKNIGSLETKIRITNLQTDDSFRMFFKDLDGLASIANEVVLKGGSSETVSITFLNSEDKSPGIYAGDLIISNSKQTKIIPVILEVESDDVLFDSNTALFPVGKIKAGDKINAEIKVFDLNRAGTASVALNYFIQDFKGNKIFSESENVIVKDQALITKGFELPHNLAPGDYLFGVLMTYEGSVGTSSQFFTINPSDSSDLFSSSFYFLIAFLIVLIFFMIFVISSFYSRDKLLEELRKHYEEERKKQEAYIEEKMKSNELQLRNNEEKKLNRKIYAKLRLERGKKLEHLHKERVQKLKKLSKKPGNKEIMEKQIARWKNEGYNVSMIKEPSVKDIQKQIADWKKKGYKTDVFSKRKV